MINNVVMKKIRYFNERQEKYNEYKLIEKAQSGCNESFEKLIQSHKEYLYKTSFLYVKNEHDALDIYQETVYKAYISLHKLRNPNYFKTWITKILINNVNMKNRYNNKFEDEEVEKYIGEVSYTYLEEKIDLYDAIDALDYKYKTPIILQYFQDLTINQISQIMDCKENTVKSYIKRGKEKLYKILEEGK